MRDYDKKRRVTVDKYSNTPPFNVKSEKTIEINPNTMNAYAVMQGNVNDNQQMRLCDIKRLYARKVNPNPTKKTTHRSKTSYDGAISNKASKVPTIRSHAVSSQKVLRSFSTNASKSHISEDTNEEKPTNHNKTHKISFTSIPEHKLMKSLLKGFDLAASVVEEACGTSPPDDTKCLNKGKSQTERADCMPSALNQKNSKLTKRSKSLFTITNPPNRKVKPESSKSTLDHTLKNNVESDGFCQSNFSLKPRSIWTNPSKMTMVRHQMTSNDEPGGTKLNCGPSQNTDELRITASHPLSEKVLKEIDNRDTFDCKREKSSLKFRNNLNDARDRGSNMKKYNKKHSKRSNKRTRCSVEGCELNEPLSEQSSVQTLNLCLLERGSERKTQLKITAQNIKPQTLQTRKQLKEVLRKFEKTGSPGLEPDPKTNDSNKETTKMSSNFSIASIRSNFENQNQESKCDILDKFKDQNIENYEVVKSTLRNFSFDQHFPQIQHRFPKENGDNFKSKSVKSIYRNTSSSTNTVASSAVSHVFMPLRTEESKSEDILDMSISKSCDVDETKKDSFVRQQVDRFNQLTGNRLRGQTGEDAVEKVRRRTGVSPTKPRSKFQLNHLTDGDGCTLVERIKRQVSIYKLENRSEDEEDDWSEDDEYTTHITFPKETRNAMSMLMTRQNNIEVQDEDQCVNQLGSPPSSNENYPRNPLPEASSSKLEVQWIPCPKNLLCNRGVHQGSCSIGRRISWPGIAERVLSSSSSMNGNRC